MKLKFSWRIFDEELYIKFHGCPSGGGRFLPWDRRTDRRMYGNEYKNFVNLKDPFCNFANALTRNIIQALRVWRLPSLHCSHKLKFENTKKVKLKTQYLSIEPNIICNFNSTLLNFNTESVDKSNLE